MDFESFLATISEISINRCFRKFLEILKNLEFLSQTTLNLIRLPSDPTRLYLFRPTTYNHETSGVRWLCFFLLFHYVVVTQQIGARLIRANPTRSDFFPPTTTVHETTWFLFLNFLSSHLLALVVHQIDTRGSQIKALQFWTAATFDGDIFPSSC